MTRCKLLTLFVIAGTCFADASSTTIRGKLMQGAGKTPALETGAHKLISLECDQPTMRVLNDNRLAGADLEARGHFSGPDHFSVDPITTKALYVYKNGKRLVITYWCDVCSIRTYSPGKCMCCQQETALDLREPDKE